MTAPARRWRPSPFLQASALCHGAALAGAAAAPSAWPWALGAVAANHALITAAGLLPRMRWLGPNITRLPPAPHGQGRVAITIDDGPDPEVTPRLLDLLDEEQAAVYEALPSRGSRDTGEVALDSGLSLPATLAALEELRARGLVASSPDGGWRLGVVQDRPLSAQEEGGG